MNRLRLRIHHRPALGVEVGGDLCISSAPMLEACVLRVLSLRPGEALILDLRAVAFCDVTALRCLWRIRDAARERGVDLDLRPSPAIARLERLVGSLAIARVA